MHAFWISSDARIYKTILPGATHWIFKWHILKQGSQAGKSRMSDFLAIDIALDSNKWWIRCLSCLMTKRFTPIQKERNLKYAYWIRKIHITAQIHTFYNFKTVFQHFRITFVSPFSTWHNFLSSSKPLFKYGNTVDIYHFLLKALQILL